MTNEIETTRELQLLSGETYHLPMLAVAVKQFRDGLNHDEVVNFIQTLMDCSDGKGTEEWQQSYDEIEARVKEAAVMAGGR